MVRLLISLHRHADWPEDAFHRAWAERHSLAAAALPGVRRYQEHGPGPDPCAPAGDCDGVAELWFDGADALHAALMSADGRTFLSAIAEQLDPRRFTLAVEELPAGGEVL